MNTKTQLCLYSNVEKNLLKLFKEDLMENAREVRFDFQNAKMLDLAENGQQ